MNRVFLASAVAAAFTAAMPFASAQSSDASSAAPTVVAAAPGAEASPAPRAKRERRAFRLPSERVEARLAYARTALKITDAQQPQWESFANVLRSHARDMDQRIQERRAQAPQARTRGAHRTVSAIERLERSQQRMTQRSARLNEVIAAAKPLYAALSPEQQQIADSMIAKGQRGGHHRGHRGHHRGMHRGA